MKRLIFFAFFALISILIVNSVYAQFDIQNFTPPSIPPSQSEPTQTAPQAPVYQRPPQNTQPNIPPQFTSGAPTCVSKDALKNQSKVKVVVVGQGRNGEFYISKKNGKDLTAKNVFNEIDRILSNLNESGSEEDIRPGLYSMTTSQEGGTCTVRISPASPTIFIYSQNTKVQPIVPILYLENNDQYLYYEYDSSNISFNKPKEGWIVDKKELKNFSNNLAIQLALNKTESERLLFELNFSASDVKSDRLFIGLIPQEEIDKNIPLKIISPNNPKVLRYHFYISPAKEKNALQPKLEEIQRNKSFILEFGSFAEKQ